jgi:F0F1-type ATP synthase gamma subunit
MTIVEEYVGLTGGGRVEHNDALAIAGRIIKTFTEDETLDKVFIIFTEFKTVMSQEIRVQQLLRFRVSKVRRRAQRQTTRKPSIFTSSRQARFSVVCCRNRSKRRFTAQCSNRWLPNKARV